MFARTMVIASLLCATSTTFLLAAEERSSRGSVRDVVFLGLDGPLFIRFDIEIAGAGIEKVRSDYVDRLFTSLDRDENQRLDRPEAEGVPMFGTMMAEGDWESLSRSELDEYVQQVMPPPFAINPKRRRTSQTILLFSKLDADENARLTEAEVAVAQHHLHKYDLNDDETYSALELQLFRNPFLSQAVTTAVEGSAELPFLLLGDPRTMERVVDNLILRYDLKPAEGEDPDGILSPAELGIDSDTYRKFDADGNELLDRQEFENLLEDPTPQLELKVAIPRAGRIYIEVDEESKIQPIPSEQRLRTRLTVDLAGFIAEMKVASNRGQLADNAAFYQISFRRSDGDKNGYLDASEFPGVGIPGATFEAVDQNGDEMVFLDEMTNYVNLQASLSQCQVVMEVAQEGKSLFEILDRNFDRRLSLRELMDASAQLAAIDINGDGKLDNSELDSRFRISIGTGQPQLFQSEGMAMPMGGGDPIVESSTSGPKWFVEMDINRDGDLSRREFLGGPEIFSRLDADGDGLVSVGEAENATSDSETAER